MAGLTVPNASDYGVTFQSIDQAEPDSLDFQILGNGNHGVVSGANITVFSAGTGSATLTAGEVIVNNVYYPVATSTVTFDAADADPRFDIIVASVTSGVATYLTVKGTASATNPVFPAISDNHTALYAIYRKSGVALSALSAVDKRKFVEDALRSGTTAPTATVNPGDLYIRTGHTPELNQSSLYVYSSTVGWQNVAKYEGPVDEGLNPFLLVGL
jgi:hypothetical protein